jgi:hypothetical protein
MCQKVKLQRPDKQKPLKPMMPAGNRKSSKGFNQENEVICCALSKLN